MVENHQITVITTDGWPITPSTVDSFMVHPGAVFYNIRNDIQSLKIKIYMNIFSL
jgi:hypothetical protein